MVGLGQKIISPVLMWLIVAAGILAVVLLLPNKWQIIPSNKYLSILMIPTLCYWMVMFFGAVWVHRQAAKSVAGISRLVTKGVYRWVRHPIYSGDIILAWGVFFLIPTARVFISVIWLSAILYLWMLLEEKGLREKFGKEYNEYARRVPGAIPCILKKR